MGILSYKHDYNCDFDASIEDFSFTFNGYFPFCKSKIVKKVVRRNKTRIIHVLIKKTCETAQVLIALAQE